VRSGLTHNRSVKRYAHAAGCASTQGHNRGPFLLPNLPLSSEAVVGNMQWHGAPVELIIMPLGTRPELVEVVVTAIVYRIFDQ
jgi:hypothetical protein